MQFACYFGFQGMAPADSPELRIPVNGESSCTKHAINRRNVKVRNANRFVSVALNFELQLI